MFSLDNIIYNINYEFIIYITLFLLVVVLFKNSNEIIIKNKNLQFFLTFILIIFSILHIFYFILSENKVSEFLYFNF